MKRMVISFAMVLLLMTTMVSAMALVPTAHTMAAADDPTARETNKNVYYAYMNIGDKPITPQFTFYTEGSDPIEFTPSNLTLNYGASTVMAISSVSDVSDGFRGSAQLKATSPMAVVMIQVPQGQNAAQPLVKNRAISNGFTTAQASSTYLIPTVLNDAFNTVTVFSVQNVETTKNVDVTITFNGTSNEGSIPFNTEKTYQDLQPGHAIFVEADDPNLGLPSDTTEHKKGFNGSATVMATGNVVATITEMRVDTINGEFKSFEGIPTGSQTVYMPYAMCKAFKGNTSAYAVQNAGTTNATVTVTYVGQDATQTISTKSIPIAPGQKESFVGCTGQKNGVLPDGFSGSATITSTGGEIVVIGKVTGAGLSTGALGGTATAGAAKVALPYIQYVSDEQFFKNASGQRTNIAIQNISGSDIPANNITVTYYDNKGEAGRYTHPDPLVNNAKFSTNPLKETGISDTFGKDALTSEYGYGSAIVSCNMANCKLSVIARVEAVYQTHPDWVPGQTNVDKVGEDYTGIPIE